MRDLISVEFKNSFVKTFPGDDSGDITPRQTPGVLYSKAQPTPVKNPTLLAWSEDLGKELEIEKPKTQREIEILAGNAITTSMYPYAACYAGHQFGNWAGQLGDGRAITLGELETRKGTSWELQLKGAGRTAYSRRADGRAVLRSSVREYLMSEAMYHLGVPTTRALSLVTTGEIVLRDMFYNGNPRYEPGAIVTRVAPSFLRFGNFELLTSRNEKENLKKLVSWTIENYFPEIQGEDKILRWFKEISERTASLIVEWLRVGFVHGVMNTDNMSILGLTIDYGPYSFLDNYDPSFTPNTTDLPGRRYAFGNQASVAYWNLGCLAGAIAPLVSDTKPLQSILDAFQDDFWKKYYNMMEHKLGLDTLRKEDMDLIDSLEDVLTAVNPDMTIFYHLLMDLPEGSIDDEDIISHFADSFYRPISFDEKSSFCGFINRYMNRIKTNTTSKETDLLKMKQANPSFILRNYLLHQAIEELEKGENDLFLKLQQSIKEPYSERSEDFFKKRPEWASQKPGCSMLSCSS